MASNIEIERRRVMSFVVKGIDIPKDGESIRLVITSSGDVVEVWGSGLAKAYHPNSAIQIPKGHGRLIDASTETTVESMSGKAMDVGMLLIALKQFVPTILESEDE